MGWVLQVIEAEPQASTQDRRIEPLVHHNVGKGLQQERRYQRQLERGVDDFHLHGRIPGRIGERFVTVCF